jgi:hypothetical protein
VALAVLAWLPTALQTLELSPPGAMRSFARTELSRLVGLEAGASVAYAVVVGGAAVRRAAAAPGGRRCVVLVYAVPQLADAVGDLVQVRVTEHLIVTPPAVLGMVGLVGLSSWPRGGSAPPADGADVDAGAATRPTHGPDPRR